MHTQTVVIGGGQAGLAMSASLAAHGVEHVVIERGRIANAWRTARWDSFRLLSPNWMTRLPGYQYDGSDPDGYMKTSELLQFFETYAARIDAPVEEHTRVRAVRRRDEGFEIATEHGYWTADSVVIATGSNSSPRIPAFASALDADIAQFTAATYRRPAQLGEGTVLVVGASATGAQLATELRASGHEVVIAVGHHVRLPRRYRGADVLAWLDRTGVFDDPASAVKDIAAARRRPSLQIVGSVPPRDLDLNTLQRDGVRLTGRLLGAEGRRLMFADDLQATAADAEAALDATLARIDPGADAAGAPPATRPEPLRVPTTPTLLDARAENITSVIWATGFTTQYPWLHIPVLDEHGAIRQAAGVTEVPGLYTIGLRFQRVRRSNFIDGVGADARLLAAHIAARLRVRAAA